MQKPILIYCQNKNLNFTEINPIFIGKWMIFPTEETWTVWWNIIKRVTEEGKLGISAKYLYNPAFISAFTSKTRGVICVYTKDYRDKKEVFEVRDKLKALGFIQRLAYKTDETTLQGKYAHNSSLVSLYWS